MAPIAAPATRLVPTGERYLDQLAHLVAEHGVAAFEGDIARLVVRLRAHGLCSPLVTLLADRDAPPIARERALGHLLGRLTEVEARRPSRVATSAA
ncbi:MAG: hypothetical protein R2713_09725 [Ilumatobacteraceae bacterium]|nr:hypothetical protein [Acidimicrobiales bacterium]MCB9395735.1 hypothetical protein [Acidimicrobiaceae bacterium]